MKKITTLFLSLFLISQIALAGQAVPFKLYPNPLTGEVLQVNFEMVYKPGQNYEFIITNVIGQTVYTHKISEDEIKRGNFTVRLDNIKLDKGVYLTKFVSGDNSSVQKLVVR